MHGCDVLNKRGFARPYMLLEYTLVILLILPKYYSLILMHTAHIALDSKVDVLSIIA